MNLKLPRQLVKKMEVNNSFLNLNINKMIWNNNNSINNSKINLRKNNIKFLTWKIMIKITLWIKVKICNIIIQQTNTNNINNNSNFIKISSSKCISLFNQVINNLMGNLLYNNNNLINKWKHQENNLIILRDSKEDINHILLMKKKIISSMVKL